MQIVNHKAYSVLVYLYVFQVAMDPRLTGKNVLETRLHMNTGVGKTLKTNVAQNRTRD